MRLDTEPSGLAADPTQGDAHLRMLLDECEKRYARLVETSPDVIYRLRLYPEVAMEYINPAGERILGYPIEHLRGLDRDALLAMLATDEQRLDATEVAAGRRFHSVHLRQWRRGDDGRVIWTEQHNMPVYDDTGRLVALEGIGRDVTEREEALQALRASEEAHRALTVSLPDLMLRLDAEGTFVAHVPTASRQPTASFLGRHVAEIVDAGSQDAARTAFKEAAAGRPASVRGEVIINGDERTYDIRFLPTGSLELYAILRDITGELWHAAEDERRASRDRLEVAVEQQIGVRNPYQLTFREFTVLHLVAMGAADKEIANQLGIAISTVNKHVSNILGKMDAASRTEAGVRAVQEGLVSVR